MLEILLKNKYEQGTCINYDQPNAGSNFGSDDILVFMKFKEVLKQKMFNIFLYSKLTTRQKNRILFQVIFKRIIIYGFCFIYMEIGNVVHTQISLGNVT